jgi:hypothetical protein
MTRTQSGSPALFALEGVKVCDDELHAVVLGEHIVVNVPFVGSYQRAVGLMPSWLITTVNPPVPVHR